MSILALEKIETKAEAGIPFGQQTSQNIFEMREGGKKDVII
jgi:hypothetical protein